MHTPTCTLTHALLPGSPLDDQPQICGCECVLLVVSLNHLITLRELVDDLL
jgi:hypothetical protein